MVELEDGVRPKLPFAHRRRDGRYRLLKSHSPLSGSYGIVVDIPTIGNLTTRLPIRTEATSVVAFVSRMIAFEQRIAACVALALLPPLDDTRLYLEQVE